MCLYPRKLRNKKYIATKKNGGNIPDPPIIGYNDLGIPIYDTRVLEIEIPCGQCEECRIKKAREWQIRLGEEIEEWKYKYFVTLTFAPEELEKLCKKHKLKECNAVAGFAVRRMLERYRKEHKVSLRHWLVTELGHEGTERIHLHGIILTNEREEFTTIEEGKRYLWKWWKYGEMYVGDYCTKRTVNYIVKYINKIDHDHEGYLSQIFCSPGIGRTWSDKAKTKGWYTYRPKNSIDYYTLNTGAKIKLPTYYKNKQYNEEDREKIWRDYMDTDITTIAGNEYYKSLTNEEVLRNIRAKAREKNREYGYGDDSGKYRKKNYNITRAMLIKQERQKTIETMSRALIKKLELKGELSSEDQRLLEKYKKYC